MQIKRARQFLQLMVIVTHGRAGLQPRGLGLPALGRKVNLDEFYRAGHLHYWM
jgi:hypothetical protein